MLQTGAEEEVPGRSGLLPARQHSGALHSEQVLVPVLGRPVPDLKGEQGSMSAFLTGQERLRLVVQKVEAEVVRHRDEKAHWEASRAGPFVTGSPGLNKVTERAGMPDRFGRPHR